MHILPFHAVPHIILLDQRRLHLGVRLKCNVQGAVLVESIVVHTVGVPPIDQEVGSDDVATGAVCKDCWRHRYAGICVQGTSSTLAASEVWTRDSVAQSELAVMQGMHRPAVRHARRTFLDVHQRSGRHAGRQLGCDAHLVVHILRPVLWRSLKFNHLSFAAVVESL